MLQFERRRNRRGHDPVRAEAVDLLPSPLTPPTSDRPGCGPLRALGSGRACRSLSCSHLGAPVVPARCECRIRPRTDGSQTNGGRCGRWQACQCRLAARRQRRHVGAQSHASGGAGAGRSLGRGKSASPGRSTAIPTPYRRLGTSDQCPRELDPAGATRQIPLVLTPRQIELLDSAHVATDLHKNASAQPLPPFGD
jgi:hypothetical protein